MEQYNIMADSPDTQPHISQYKVSVKGYFTSVSEESGD